MSTLERIKKLFVKEFEIDEAAITPGTSVESLGLDSLDKIEFMFVLENEFGLKIETRDIKINSVQDIVESIDRLAAEQHGGAAR